MAKDYDYPIYDAGGRVKKEKEGRRRAAGDYGYDSSKKSPNKDLKYGGHNPGYQKYLDKQDFGTAFRLAKTRYDQFKWRGKVYNTKTKEEAKKK